MMHKTKGIVLHSIKYSETSVIVKIYTELFGLQSYLFKGIHGRTSKFRPVYFQTLTLLDMEVYHRQKHNIQSAKEIRFAYPYQQIPYDIRRSSVALFMNELIYKSIREEEANPSLFGFLWQALLQLDTLEDHLGCFHLVFCMQLTRFLGIMPHNNYSADAPIFNLRDGNFQAGIPEHHSCLNLPESQSFHLLLTTPLELYGTLSFSPAIRNRLLETMITYYQLHLPGFKGLQSHHVLHSVLS